MSSNRSRNVVAFSAFIRAFVVLTACVCVAFCACVDARCDENVASFPGCSLLSKNTRDALAFERKSTTVDAPSLTSNSDEPELDASARFADVVSFEPTSELTQDAVVYRGANLSDLTLQPYRGRFFGYVDAGWGSQESQNDTIDATGFDVGTYGGGIGQDWTLTQNFIWGYGIQANQTKIDPKRNMYDANVDSLSGFLRMTVFDALWHVDVAYGGAKSWQKQNKIGVKNANKFSASQWYLETEFGARFDKGYTRIEPRVNFRVLNFSESEKAERFRQGKAYCSDFSDASYRLKLGSRFSWEYQTFLATLKPYLTADWSHEFGSRSIYTIGDLAPIPVAYRFGAHRMARDKIELGGGVGAEMRETLDLFMQYEVVFAKEYSEYLFFAGFNKKF